MYQPEPVLCSNLQRTCGLSVKPPRYNIPLVMAAVRVVFPWSTWPMVPMLTWGLSRLKASEYQRWDQGERAGDSTTGAQDGTPENVYISIVSVKGRSLQKTKQNALTLKKLSTPHLNWRLPTHSAIILTNSKCFTANLTSDSADWCHYWPFSTCVGARRVRGRCKHKQWISTSSSFRNEQRQSSPSKPLWEEIHLGSH